MNLQEALRIEREMCDDISKLLLATAHKYGDQGVDRAVINSMFNSAMLKFCTQHHVQIFIRSTTFAQLKPVFIDATSHLLDNAYSYFLETHSQ